MQPTVMPVPADLAGLSDQDLLTLRSAGQEVMTCLAAIGRAATNPVARVLKHGGEFFEDAHYPDGDVFDSQSASQYYYHAHRAGTGEHGHFHTFIRAKGMPDDIAPAPYAGTSPPPTGDDAICHLVAVSMNAAGLPVGLFTTNRWVTAETFYSADDTIRLLAGFEVDHADPCWATNRWLTAMLRLFAPQIKDLIRTRDATIAAWQASHPGPDVYEDRELEVTSELAIDIDEQIAAVDAVLVGRGYPQAI
jgi:hypothetical protein